MQSPPIRRVLAHSVGAALLCMFIQGAAHATERPIRIISAQYQPQSKEAQQYTPDDVPIVLVGEADAKKFVVGDVARSYDFILYDVTKMSDTGQNHSGFAYIVDGKPTQQRPTGPYRFVIRYWLPRSAAATVALHYKGKPISDAAKVSGEYRGPAF